MRRILWLFILCFSLVTVQTTALAAAATWGQVAGSTSDILDQSLETYRAGNQSKAVKQVDEAYLGPFESEGMEAAIRMSISGQRAFEHEYLFRQIKQQYAVNAPAGEVAATINELKEMLSRDAAKMDGGSSNRATLFVSSFLIILREGFEAILVIGALAAYMIKSGNQDKVRTIYSAAGIAVLASIATAFVLNSLIKVSGASQEVIEGVTMLLAVAVLFFVSFWLLSKAQAQAWQSYIEGKIKSSLTTGSMMALWSAAFLAVYREGAETILFYGALAGGANAPGARTSLIGGFVLGLLALIIVYLVIRLGSVKIPLRTFFTVTGNFLYLLAFIFAGGAINELQAGGVIGATSIRGFPAVDLLGIYPTWESLSLQMLLIMLYAAGFFYQRLAGRQSVQEAKG